VYSIELNIQVSQDHRSPMFRNEGLQHDLNPNDASTPRATSEQEKHLVISSTTSKPENNTHGISSQKKTCLQQMWHMCKNSGCKHVLHVLT
jgi:hypothetical protein